MSAAKRERWNRILQSLGFAFLLLYIIFPGPGMMKLIFWMGAVLTLAGTALEIANYAQFSKIRQEQYSGLFVFGVIAKILLLASVVARIYEVNNSVFILLGSIILVFIYTLIQTFIGAPKKEKSDVLDLD
ncbi:MAG: hypothetical protein ACOVQJ_01200 [Bacteroidia bacterium]|jgi:hypothetical protein